MLIDVPYTRVRPNIALSPFIWSCPSKIDTHRPEVLNCQWHSFVKIMVHLSISTPCNGLTMISIKLPDVMKVNELQEQRKMNEFLASISGGIFGLAGFWDFWQHVPLDQLRWDYFDFWQHGTLEQLSWYHRMIILLPLHMLMSPPPSSWPLLIIVIVHHFVLWPKE